VWQTVGLELGLEQHYLDMIAEDNRSCEKASKVMLFKWRRSNSHPSYKVLEQVVKNCIAYTSGISRDCDCFSLNTCPTHMQALIVNY